MAASVFMTYDVRYHIILAAMAEEDTARHSVKYSAGLMGVPSF